MRDKAKLIQDCVDQFSGPADVREDIRRIAMSVVHLHPQLADDLEEAVKNILSMSRALEGDLSELLQLEAKAASENASLLVEAALGDIFK